MKSAEPASYFSLRVATIAGLESLEANAGVISSGPLLVMTEYSFDELWQWLEATVDSCQAESWSDSVMKLRRHFSFGD